MTDHKKSVELLEKAAAAMAKLPDNCSLIGLCMTEENGEERIGLHIYAENKNGILPVSDEDALRKYAENAGIKMWYEHGVQTFGKMTYDYLHVLDENGTMMYQGLKRRCE